MEKTRIIVAGRWSDAFFHKSKLTAQKLEKDHPNEIEADIQGMFPFDWDMFLIKRTSQLGGPAAGHKQSPLVTLQKGNAADAYLGGMDEFLDWANKNHKYSDFRPVPLMRALAKTEYKKILIDRYPDHKYVFMELHANGTVLGQITLDLFVSKCPRTCENFLQLCTGTPAGAGSLAYKGSPVHRIVKGGWIQGGDILGGHGDGGASIYGPTFEDENFMIDFSLPGMLAMANHGPHTNNSQFFVTLKPLNCLWKTFVAFGRVIDGWQVLQMVEALEIANERPNVRVTIGNCGVHEP